MNRLFLGLALLGAVLWGYQTRQPDTPTQTSPAIITYASVTPKTVVLVPTPTTPSTEAPTTTQAPTTTIPTLVGPDTPCQEWVPLALEVGWPADRTVIEKLLAVMYRESRCQPEADSGPDHGLLQINQIHRAWLNSGWGWTHDDMFDPRKNLTFALALWQGSGWKPWRFSGGA